MDSDAQEKKPKKSYWFSLLSTVVFYLSICARASYQAIDLATDTATYTYICIYQHTYLHRRTFNVQHNIP